MKNLVRSVISAAAALLALSPVAEARLRDSWPSAKLAEKADVIVVAKLVSIKDAKKSDPPPKGRYQDKLVGVDSTFRVLAVLKGKHEGQQLTLFHFRWEWNKVAAFQIPDIIDGPNLIAFDPMKDKEVRVLLYLKKRPDGRYECVSGQEDPDLSVARLEGRTDDR
jgi:hypothetical protein